MHQLTLVFVQVHNHYHGGGNADPPEQTGVHVVEASGPKPPPIDSTIQPRLAKCLPAPRLLQKRTA